VSEESFALCPKNRTKQEKAKLSEAEEKLTQGESSSNLKIYSDAKEKYESALTAANQECLSLFGNMSERREISPPPIASCKFPSGCKIKNNAIPVMNHMSSIGGPELLAGEILIINFAVYDPEGTSISTRVEWGDGTTADLEPKLATKAQPLASSVSHSYSDPGDYLVRFIFTDLEGNTTQKYTSFHVIPTKAARIDKFRISSENIDHDKLGQFVTTANTDLVFRLSIATNEDIFYKYTIDWGDGSKSSTGLVSAIKASYINHNFKPGVYRTKISIEGLPNEEYTISAEGAQQDESIIKIISPSGGETILLNEQEVGSLSVKVQVYDTDAYGTGRVYLQTQGNIEKGGYNGAFLGEISLTQEVNQKEFILDSTTPGAYKLRVIGVKYKNCSSSVCEYIIPDDRTNDWITIK